MLTRVFRWTVVLLCTAGLIATSGYLVWHHQQTVRDEHHRAEFTAAARQVVVTLMSIDFEDPHAGLQRIVDNSTGTFRDEFQAIAQEFVALSEDAAVRTETVVNATAVEEVTTDSAVVLVTATSTMSDAAGAADAPRSWRLSVELQRDGDQIKMSGIEFLM